MTLVNRILERFGFGPSKRRSATRAERRGPQLQIAVIAELSIPACKLYRVDHKARALERLGCRVDVVNWWNPEACRRALQTCNLAIFYRVGLHPSTRPLFEEARRLGVRTMFETDDLIFERALFAQRPSVLARPAVEQAELLDGVDAYRAALLACDDVIVSTDALARQIRPLTQGRVFTVENTLEPAEFALAEAIRRDPLPRRPGTVVIGYGSGTRTHDADFAVVTPALALILDRFPHVELALHGELDVPEPLGRFTDQIVQLPLLPWEDYLRAKATWDVNLAPLEPGVFNDVKSTIKFLEAAAVELPSVCSPTAPYRDLIVQGINGFVADSTEEWASALTALIEDPARRADIAREALNTARARCDPQRIAERELRPLLDTLPLVPPSPRVVVVDDGGLPDEGHAAASLARAGIATVALFCPGGDGAPGDLRREARSGMDIFRVPVPQRTPPWQYWDPDTAERFERVLAAWSPAIVVVVEVRRLGITIVQRCRAAGIPYVIALEDLWWLQDDELAAASDACGPTADDIRRCASRARDPALAWHRYVELRDILSSAAALVTSDARIAEEYRRHGLPSHLVRNGPIDVVVRALLNDAAQ